MKILLINNDGGGFADHIDIDEGTSVAALFAQRLPGRKSEDFLIRVNRQPVSADQILHEGDRISITPTKIEGSLSCSFFDAVPQFFCIILAKRVLDQ